MEGKSPPFNVPGTQLYTHSTLEIVRASQKNEKCSETLMPSVPQHTPITCTHALTHLSPLCQVLRSLLWGLQKQPQAFCASRIEDRLLLRPWQELGGLYFKKKKEGRKEKKEKLEEKVTIFKCHLVRVAWWCHVAPPTPPHSYPTHLGWLEATAHIVFQL